MAGKAKTRWLPLWHLFPNGQVEYGTGQPGYRWSPAYSQAISATSYSQPLRRSDWYAMARRDGAKVKFHADRAAAMKAAGFRYSI